MKKVKEVKKIVMSTAAAKALYPNVKANLKFLEAANKMSI